MFGTCPQVALVFWRGQGVDGVQLSGVERVASVVPSLWADIRAIVQNNGTDVEKKRYVIYISLSIGVDLWASVKPLVTTSERGYTD